MTRYAILLDNGAMLPIKERTKELARVRINVWRAARRHALKERALLTPRLVLGLVIYRRGSSAAATLGKAGGNARARSLSAERRRDIARQAAQARWGKSPRSRPI